jgi:hypothetical protein
VYSTIHSLDGIARRRPFTARCAAGTFFRVQFNLVWFYPLIAVLTTLACLGTHEFGHVVAAWLTGGHVSEVVLFSSLPHVLVLDTASPAQEAFRAAAGSLASLAACLVFVLATPRGARWQFARDSATAFAYVELTGWSLSSLLYGHSPSSDDAQYFLQISGMSPHIVALICVALAAAGLVVLRLRGQRGTVRVVPTAASIPVAKARSAAAGE